MTGSASTTRRHGTAKRVTGRTRGRTRSGVAPEAFARLLADKERQAERRHGALEVAMAIAATTAKVRVDAAATPFEPTPSDLLDCTFDDTRVGLDRAGMVAFKSNLSALLPAIAADVQAIPEDPSLRIRDVARYVAASLRAEEGAARERVRPRAGGFVVTSAGPMQQARERVRDRYGSHFAAKATDAVLSMMGQSAEREGGVGVRAMRAGVAAPAGELALIVELTPRAEPSLPARETATLETAMREAARLQDAETRDRHVGTAQMWRQTRLPSMRDEFYKTVAPLYAEIGKRANSNARREAMGSRRLLDMCWLNETIRTAAAAVSLADVASDPRIEHIDLPRRLEREMRLCGPLVGAPVFRTRTSKDGTGIVVAVIDGEVDVVHPALAGRVMHKRNLTREPFGVPDDHGTAVAGIVGASDRRFGGIAPGVSILNYKIFAADPRLDSDDFDGSLAIQQALEDGAHVANCSWGAGPAGDGTGREARACDAAWNLGMVVVKSAGNRGPGARTLTTPADADGVIVVGATDRRGRAVESYSSRGPAGARERPHLLAPGGSALSGVETCLPGGRFGNAGAGTSFAAPQVSGLAALLLDDDPDLLPDAVRETLIRACRRLARVDVASQGAGLIRLR
jgi:serine protease AprX